MTDFLPPQKSGLIVIDMQTGLVPHMDRGHQILDRIVFMLQCAEVLELPMFATEQVPERLGHILPLLKEQVTTIYPKCTFSVYRDEPIRVAIEQMDCSHFILMGVESHICLLQTAKDLIKAGKKVVVCNDATSSRSLYDFSTAMGELRDVGARISSTETVVYELLQEAGTPLFKKILPILKRDV